MAKISIDCDIRSADSKLVFQTTGTLQDHVMTFQDPSHDTHVLTLNNDSAVYEKQGQTQMVFQFDRHQTTKGTYQVMGQAIEFEIETTKYLYEEGLIRISYHLKQDNELVGQTSLAIDYRNKEEM